jgi:hypothetical protein
MAFTVPERSAGQSRSKSRFGVEHQPLTALGVVREEFKEREGIEYST